MLFKCCECGLASCLLCLLSSSVSSPLSAQKDDVWEGEWAGPVYQGGRARAGCEEIQRHDPLTLSLFLSATWLCSLSRYFLFPHSGIFDLTPLRSQKHLLCVHEHKPHLLAAFIFHTAQSLLKFPLKNIIQHPYLSCLRVISLKTKICQNQIKKAYYPAVCSTFFVHTHLWFVLTDAVPLSHSVLGSMFSQAMKKWVQGNSDEVRLQDAKICMNDSAVMKALQWNT